MSERLKPNNQTGYGFPPETIKPTDWVHRIEIMTSLGRQAMSDYLLPGGDTDQADLNLVMAAALLMKHPWIASGKYKIWGGVPTTDICEGLFEISSCHGESGLIAQRIVVERGQEMNSDTLYLIASYADGNNLGHTDYWCRLEPNHQGQYSPSGKHQRIKYY